VVAPSPCLRSPVRMLRRKTHRLQHDFTAHPLDPATSTLDHDNCLEVLVGAGKAGTVQKIATR